MIHFNGYFGNKECGLDPCIVLDVLNNYLLGLIDDILVPYYITQKFYHATFLISL